jgi:hypothetical protein
MTTPEPYDLNEKLSEAYTRWQQTYLTGMLQLPGESTADYCDRMCSIAFMEGAKTMQFLTNQALLEIYAEQGK